MRGASLFLPTALIAFPALAGQQESNLDLYAASSLMGMHSHPIDTEGQLLVNAERAFAKRREKVAAWLRQTEGEQAVEQVNEELWQQVHDIYWVSGPTVEEEWRRLKKAQRILAMLERKMHDEKVKN